MFRFYAEVDVGIKDSIAARIEGLTLDGELYNDSDGTQTGGLPLLDSEDDDSPKHSKITKIQRNWPKDWNDGFHFLWEMTPLYAYVLSPSKKRKKTKNKKQRNIGALIFIFMFLIWNSFNLFLLE